MPRRKQEQKKWPEARPAGGESARITPVDIQQKEFGLAFRGYNERDVDQFLDEVTEEVARLYAENKRLREELEFARTSRLDLGGAEEAQAVLRQAKEEAARLLAEARARASVVDPGTEAPAGRGTAAALAPFVAQEREFLQSLANLIQTHAEGVKDQIRRARDAAAHATAREASTQASAREADQREAAARAALEEEATAQAAFREAAARPARREPAAQEDVRSSAPSDAEAEERMEAPSPVHDTEDEGSGPPTQPWRPEELQLQPSPPEDWKDYYAPEGSEDQPEPPDEILDLTEASGDRPGARAEDERDERERGRRTLEPQRAALETELSEDDSLEDRSIRELFWGEDY